MGEEARRLVLESILISNFCEIGYTGPYHQVLQDGVPGAYISAVYVHLMPIGDFHRSRGPIAEDYMAPTDWSDMPRAMPPSSLRLVKEGTATGSGLERKAY